MNNFLIILISLVSFSLSAQTDYSGDYAGKLEVMGTELPLVFHITQKDDTYKGTLDSPKQGAFDIPVTIDLLKNDSLEISVSSIGATYAGEFIEPDSVAGEFTQNGRKIELALKKGEVKGPERPQNPERPYPYNEEEVHFKNEEAGIELTGTLTRPQVKREVPAVILVTGSGPQDRNASVFGHKPFLVISDYLTRRGIAVLRYDERGVGDSEGKFAGATTFDFADDAAAAIDFLSKQDGVDDERIGVVGHSEGGAVAEILGVKSTALDYAVMLAGPAIQGDDLLLQQKRELEEKSGVSGKEITKGMTLNRGAFDIVKKTPLDEVEQKLNTYYDENGVTDKQRIKALNKTLIDPWMKEFLRFDPLEWLKNSTVPFLALFGSKDVQVPSESNAKALEGLPHVRVKIFAGLNHLFQDADTGLPREYAEIKQTISPGVMKTVEGFIKDQ